MRKRHFELIWIKRRLTSLDICAQTMLESLTNHYHTELEKKIMVRNEILITLSFHYKLVSTRDDGSCYIGM